MNPAKLQAPPSRPTESMGAPRRLNSWKEIASYFDRDIRTVQLWEKKEGLPVHRHEHDARSSVYAIPSELELWFNHRSRKSPITTSPLAAANPLRDSAAEMPAHAAADQPAAEPNLLNSQASLSRLWLPMACLALGCLATMATLRLRHISHGYLPATVPSSGTATAPLVLAVLPFQDLSNSSSRSLWVDGFTDDLITELGRNRSLQVISRRSTMQFRKTHEPLMAIASQLHASLLLEGTVAHTKDETRITVQLIDAAHDRELWSERYTRPAGDILSIQDEVASNITNAVIDKLTGKPLAPELGHASPRPVDPQARLDYLTGNYYLNQRDEPSLLQAIDSFHHAIARAPNYAQAYAGLADCYNLLSVWGHFSSAQGFPRSREAALTALRLDPNSAEAYTALAFETFRYEWNASQAETYFRKAIELNPNYAPAHHWYGQYLVDLRRFDAGFEELRKARDLDPLSAIIASDLADGYIYAHRDEEAVALLKQTIQLYPSFVPAQAYLVSAYEDAGNLDAANAQAQTYLRLSGDDGPLLGVKLRRLLLQGDVNKARQDAQPLIKQKQSTPVGLADLYFSLGEKEEGYAALDRAVQQRDWWLITLLDDPSFDGIRKEPRFLAIEQRVGLPTDRN